MENGNLRKPRKDLRNLNNPALAAHFPRTRQEVLAATHLDHHRSWYLSDLARHLGSQPTSLQRELATLVEAGILQRRTDGNRVYFQADERCPYFEEIRGLMRKAEKWRPEEREMGHARHTACGTAHWGKHGRTGFGRN